MGLPDGVAALRGLVDGQLAQLDEAEKAGRGSPARMPAATRAAIEGWCTRILNTGVAVIPGQHGGISNQQLADILTASGRAWWKVSRRLVDDFLKPVFLQEFAGREPDERRAHAVATTEFRRVLGLRFTLQLRDVGRIKALTPRYAKAKAAAGYGGLPPGVRTGRLANASIRSAVLVW